MIRGYAPGWLQPRSTVTGATEWAGTGAGWYCGSSGAGGPGRTGEARGRRDRGRFALPPGLRAPSAALGTWARAADGSSGCPRCGRRPGSSSGTLPSRPLTPRSSPASPRRWPSSGRKSRGGGPRWGRGARGSHASRARPPGAPSCRGASAAAGVSRGWVHDGRQGLPPLSS